MRMLLRLLLLAPLAAFAQGSLVADWQKQYDSWYWKAPRAKVEAPRWSDNGHTLAYGWLGKSGLEWRLVDCESGQSRPAFETAALVKAFAAIDGRKADPRNWPFKRVVPTEGGRLRLESDKESWWLGREGKLVLAAGASPTKGGPG